MAGQQHAHSLVLPLLAATILMFICIASGEECTSPRAIPIRIGNITLSNGQVARGLEVAVGSPPQSLAFMPQWPLNNTYVWGPDGHCTMSFTLGPQCTTFRGGSYNSFASKSRKAADQTTFTDSGNAPAVSTFADTIILGLTSTSNNTSNNDSTSLEGFPMGVAASDSIMQGYHTMHTLGLGPGSTLLSRLRSNKLVPSRSWSMFWGRTGATPQTQLDGLFVLGGYDRAKVTGPKHMAPISQGTGRSGVCPTGIAVTIVDIIVELADGQSLTSFPSQGSSALSACVTPDYPGLLTLPLDPYFSSIKKLINATRADSRSLMPNFWANKFDPSDNPFKFDLTIKLQSGLAIRIPHDQLVVPDQFYDNSTGEARVNTTSPPTIAINAIQQVNRDDQAQLGRLFLSAAYLFVNLDANQYTLWQANPTEQRDLVGVDEKGAEIAGSCAGQGDAGRPSSEPSSTPQASVERGGLSGGVIGGIAAAAVVGLALVAGGVWLWVVKKRRSAAMTAMNPQDARDDAPVKITRPADEFNSFHENNKPRSSAIVDGWTSSVRSELPSYDGRYDPRHGPVESGGSAFRGFELQG